MPLGMVPLSRDTTSVRNICCEDCRWPLKPTRAPEDCAPKAPPAALEMLAATAVLGKILVVVVVDVTVVVGGL